MRLAVVTPLDAQATGVADYSRDLLPPLAAVADHEIVVYTDRAGATQSGTGWHARPIADLPSTARNFDLIIYQMGNGPAHDFMATAVYDHPGLLVLHDISLHYFFARQSRSRYLQAMGYGYDLAGTALGRQFLRGFIPINYPEYLVSEILVDRSPGVIVHSQQAAELLRVRCPSARVSYVPHLLSLPAERSQAALRKQLGLAADVFLVGVFGVLNDSKQPRAILAALRLLLDEGMPISAVFMGRENDTFHLREEATRLNLSEHLHVMDFVADFAVIHDWLAACDVSLHLRSPYWGETSGSTLHALAVGTPVIVNDIGSFSELPDDACLKLPPDLPDLPQQLASALRALSDQPNRRAAMRIAARRYVATELDPRLIAARYLEVARSILELA